MLIHDFTESEIANTVLYSNILEFSTTIKTKIIFSRSSLNYIIVWLTPQNPGSPLTVFPQYLSTHIISHILCNFRTLGSAKHQKATPLTFRQNFKFRHSHTFRLEPALWDTHDHSFHYLSKSPIITGKSPPYRQAARNLNLRS